MTKPTCLIIAGSRIDTDAVVQAGLADKLRNAFEAECIFFANTVQELEEYCANCKDVLALLYLNSFPITYEEILNWAKPITNICNIYRVSFDGRRVWIYNHNTVINCVTEEDLPGAIRADLQMASCFERIASPIAFILCLIFLSIAIAHGSHMHKLSEFIYGESVNETTNELTQN